MLAGVLHDLGAEDLAARHHASADPEAAARLRQAVVYLRWKGRFSARAGGEIPELLDFLATEVPPSSLASTTQRTTRRPPVTSGLHPDPDPGHLR